MRIHFAGSFSGTDPILLIFTTPGEYTFDKTLYPEHTMFDVMVVGGGGGNGGGMQGPDPSNTDWDVVNFGGAGGGGGSHRLQGLLDILSNLTPIVVGAAGADGADGGTDPDAGTDGADGETSSFGDFVMASGGKGGLRSGTLDFTLDLSSYGGDGGLGGSDTSGGGGLGGIVGLNNDPTRGGVGHHGPATNGIDGMLTLTANGMIGGGGGGGAGGAIRKIDGVWDLSWPIPSYGGRGSYNLDELVSTPVGNPGYYTPAGTTTPLKVKPGKGGGARITPFNKSNATYGDSQKNGIVIIRLTAQ